MKRFGVLALVGGVAALAVATPLCAQTIAGKPAKPAAQSAAPWYERFTFGSDDSTNNSTFIPRSEPKVSLLLSPRSRWGFTVATPIAPSPRYPNVAASVPSSAGAFYQLTPRLRVGGGVTLPTEQFTPGGRVTSSAREPGVKLESSLKF
jgi:hypothetical protein